ncbi:MAG TPA: hypothetical protein VGL15_12250, partial [Vicinamibacteria bacterium]
TTVRMLAKHLTAENHRELLAEASGKSKHEVEKLLARRFPQPDTPASARRLPPPRPMPAPPAPPSNGANAAAADAASKGSITLVAAPPSSRRFLPRPLSPDRYEIRFTASASSYERLRFAGICSPMPFPASAIHRAPIRSGTDWVPPRSCL